MAVQLSNEKQQGGTSAHDITVDVLNLLKEAWLKADPAVQQRIEKEQPSIERLTPLFESRILIITSNPRGANKDALRLDKEINTIRQRVKLGSSRDRIHIENITAASVDDLRVELFSKNYDVIHFSGHANADGLEFMSEEGTHTLSFDAFAKMLKTQQNLKCVVLNACSAMQGLETAFAPLVVAMVDEIDDDESIEFAKGFYDALAAGKSPDEAYESGVTALEAADFNPHVVAKLTK